ncbi:MAG TPA: CBS domain-containing protein [Methanobacterium sp.]|nr:CBS domain-containing protein [Methanobacterium sp.]
MKVNEVMSDEVIVIGENEQVSHARNLMLKHGLSRVIVVDKDENPVGIVTEKDLTRKLRGKGPAWKKRPIDKISIRRVMSNGLQTISADEDVKDAVELMLQKKISSVPVVDSEGIAGIVTKTDLMNFYISKYSTRWKVSDLMTKDVVTANENHTITHIISIMEENSIDGLVVMFDSEIAGIITPADISFAMIDDPETGVSVERIYFIRQLAEGGDKRKARDVSMLTAGDIMTEDYVKISPGADALEAAKIMSDESISHIPVVEGEELVGIITKTDIIKGIQ